MKDFLLNMFRILFDQTFNILSYHSMNIFLIIFSVFLDLFEGMTKVFSSVTQAEI